jgi:sugar phosphate isomerase/epimerase
MSYAATWGGEYLDLEDVVDAAAEFGYDGLMLMGKRPHASPLDLSRDRVAALKRRLETTKLEVVSIAAYNDFTARIGADQGAQYPSGIPLLELQFLHVRHCVEIAHDLEAPFVRIFTGFEHGGATPGEAWQASVEAIRDCGRRAAELGVTLAVQNHHDVANHHQTLSALVEEVDLPNMRLAYDAWVPALQGLTALGLESSATELGPLVAYTTVADYEIQPRFHYDKAAAELQSPGTGRQGRPDGRRLRRLRRVLSWPGSRRLRRIRGLRDVLSAAGWRQSRESRPLRARFVEWVRTVETQDSPTRDRVPG